MRQILTAAYYDDKVAINENIKNSALFLYNVEK